MTSNTPPTFLIKSTLACSIIVDIFLLPFFFYAITEGRFLLAFLICIVGIGCALNVWHGIKNKYNLWLNSYFLSPMGTVAITYAFFNLGVTGSYWPFLLILSNYFVLPEKRAWFFTLLTLFIFIPASWYVLPIDTASRFVAVLIITSLFITMSMREIYKLHSLLEEKAILDHLTQLYNRSSLTEYLLQAIARNKRSNMPVTLILIDIDFFKSINDNYGHDKGDEILIKISSLFRKRVRESDRAFRIGGEEFLILLNDTNEENGAEFANNLRKQIEQTNMIPEHPITISSGVCGLEQGMDMSSWLKSCDLKLYQAKKGGRNRVIV
jgi:diguanylate cyclase (GGDEF)-like protein